MAANPQNYYYTETHEWICEKGGSFRVGITHYAQEQLGDITFVELPATGDSFKKGQRFGILESVKAVSDLYAPCDLKVKSANKKLQESPELINQSPFEEGWLVEVSAENKEKWHKGLLTADKYEKLIGA